jgi:hypothetical protein
LPGLEHQPRLFAALLPLRSRGQPLRQLRELADEVRRRGRDDARPGAVDDLDQALLLEEEQRLAHGGPADAEALHQVLLGRQAVADAKFAAVDQLGDLVCDIVRPLSSHHRCLRQDRIHRRSL